jgi:alkylated DNA nucleotide flippase Atl1
MSVVDSILARFHMTWRTDPYRIVNSHGVIVQKGPHFDLSETVLKRQSAHLNAGKLAKGTGTSPEI